MPNHASLTYAQLHDRLRSLGFQEHQVELDGKSGLMFEHRAAPKARIILPERKPDDLVEPFDQQYVLAILRSRGLLPESNPLLA